jgi:CubicO group peptidase (beta-lactamase class C family)
MSYLRYLILAVLVFPANPVNCADRPLEDLVRADSIECVMDAAVASGLISGGTVLIGNGDADLFVGTYGAVSSAPQAPPVRSDTIFDLASLTKVIATTPAIMKLIDEGRLHLLDPVTKWFPEFAAKGRDDMLVLHLVTHTSGLGDFSVSSCGTMQGVVETAATHEPAWPPGTRFKYADINFILLGELVRRVSGVELSRYVGDTILLPLGMTDTSFNPASGLRNRCAATLDASNGLLFGTAQDHVARFLGGAAGHAGLFGTAVDLARFCRMLLRGGELAGKRVLSEEAFRQMTTPFSIQDGKVVRAVGWDMRSPFSAPRGTGFSGASFGHTGYSGCSVWIDPESDLFVILLTSRRDYRRNGDFRRLRSDISTLAAAIFSGRENRSPFRAGKGSAARQKT